MAEVAISSYLSRRWWGGVLPTPNPTPIPTPTPTPNPKPDLGRRAASALLALPEDFAQQQVGVRAGDGVGDRVSLTLTLPNPYS